MTTKLLLFFFIFPAFFCQSVMAEHSWYPYPVEVWDAPFNVESKRSKVDYIPLASTTANWNICVSFPHMKDTYWLAVNFGISQEIKRFGCTMHLYQANGYENIDIQIKQIRQCVQKGADGVIIGSISYDALNDLIAELKEKNIPVIDVINGISSENVSAKSLVSFEEMGYKSGRYIVKKHLRQKDNPVKIAWFPGPAGAGWVTAGNKGLIDAIANTNIEIIATRYGDTGKAVQSRLIGEILDKYSDDLDYIVGTGVTAEAAVKILRKRGLTKRIKIVSYYLTPGVYLNILRGKILASMTDFSVIQGRIAVDQLVRILDNKPYYKKTGPILHVIDANNINSFDKKSMLAPTGFQATYSVNKKISD